jgi:hypothetical protein
MDVFNTGSFDLGVYSLLKWLYVVGFGLYVVFTLIVWQQVNLMSRSLNGIMELPLKIMAVMMVLLGLTALALSLIIL